MDDYRWFDFENSPLRERFPDLPWLSGAQEWRAGVLNRAFTDLGAARQWLDSIRSAPRKSNATRCPRVFVSHRQADQAPAIRIAWLAWQEGFDYWLDIIDLDPSRNRQIRALETSLGRPLTPFEKSVLTAAIIEMALLNCTHVIAAMTIRTAGSQWVPYEYGRTNSRTPRNARTACWWDNTSLPQSDLPEYVHLANVHEREQDIRAWFGSELAQFSQCPGTPRGVWSGATPNTLPTG